MSSAWPAASTRSNDKSGRCPIDCGLFAERTDPLAGERVRRAELAHRAPRVVKIEQHHLFDAAHAIERDRRSRGGVGVGRGLRRRSRIGGLHAARPLRFMAW